MNFSSMSNEKSVETDFYKDTVRNERAPHEDEIANNDKRSIIQVAAFKSIFSCRLNARLDISI